MKVKRTLLSTDTEAHAKRRGEFYDFFLALICFETLTEAAKVEIDTRLPLAMPRKLVTAAQ